MLLYILGSTRLLPHCCLNPYCSGICSYTYNVWPDARRSHRGLNPYCSGICSYTLRTLLKESNCRVLILIVVEYALIRKPGSQDSHLVFVLILIVVEYALIQQVLKENPQLNVLILIVVEYALILTILAILYGGAIVLILIVVEYALIRL